VHRSISVSLAHRAAHGRLLTANPPLMAGTARPMATLRL